MLRNMALPYKKTNRCSLTATYLCGLALIIIVMAMTLALLLKQIHASENDAYIINVSGKQRMLSQRIAVMAHQILVSHSKKHANVHALQMANAVEEMVNNHNSLSYGTFKNGIRYKLSPQMQNIYYSKDGLDQKVRTFITLSEQFLFNYINKGLSNKLETELIERISHLAADDLVHDLDKAVYQYERETTQKLERFKELTIVFFIIGLLVILLEIKLIFNPMVNKIVRDQKELAYKNAELTEFSYRVSHDLRAPIVSAIGLAQNTIEAISAKDYKQAELSVLHMKNGLTNLEKLTEDVTELTKMKVKDIPEEYVHFDYITELAIRAIENMPHFNEVRIEKDIHIHEPILIKRLFLQQILENLISNAIKYSDQNKTDPFVKISAKENNGKLIINIRDNGVGIPTDYQDKIFSMFQRFHPKMSYGSGLGLYLVKQNVQALNGRVYYFGLPEGTEFRIVMPIKIKKEEDHENRSNR